MTEESKTVLRGTKVANIINSISELFHITLQEATDVYYYSATSELIENGVSDLQCRSDKYLATLVWEEFQDKNKL